MGDKQGNLAVRAAGGLAAFAAGYVTRKVLTLAWTKATGKEPPTNPEDPEVALVEAIAWTAIVGVGAELARLLATRAAAKRWGASPTAPLD